MDKQEIKNFFDEHAPTWDAEMERNDDIVKIILDNAGVLSDVSVLDVACGTGVLVGDYLARGVSRVVGVDISPKMIDIAKSKYFGEKTEFVCADIETAELNETFDCCMVYNAFPHFPDPANLIRVLAQNLKSGGMLSIAHGKSRDAIDHHHSGSASKVSMGLMSADDLAKLMEPYFEITVKISDDKMYQVAGRKI